MDRLDAMRAYVRLVELGRFSAVAAELRIQQSTVSKWIASLEEELGVQLVERTTRSCRVTEAGALFYDRSVELVAGYDDVTAQLQDRHAELRGRLRVSVPVVFGRRFIVPHMAKLLRRHRGLELELELSDRYVNVVDDRIDVAVRVGVPVDSTLRGRTLWSTRRHLVASPGYLTKHPALSSPKDLQTHACLLHSGLSAGDVWTFRQDGRTVRAHVHGRFSANNSDALCSMARSGLGIALLAEWLVDTDLKSGKLVSLLPEFEPPPAPVQVLLPPGRFVHPRARAFVDFLVDTFAESADN